MALAGSFNGQTVVSGAGHGIGRAIAGAFAAREAHVWACDILEDALAETRGRVEGQLETAVFDV